jgi:hypothetical protein
VSYPNDALVISTHVRFDVGDERNGRSAAGHVP